jgi:phage terminase large subunit-like protein
MGRRAGKSFIVALIAVYLAAFKEYAPYLAPGERATIQVIAADRKQARTIFRYVSALLTQVPMLTALIERQDSESIDLTNAVSIEITTCSFRSVRGYTCAACICDEISFWMDGEISANPAVEILNAIRPAMATIPNAMLLCIGTPYRKAGPLYEAYQRYYGGAHVAA